MKRARAFRLDAPKKDHAPERALAAGLARPATERERPGAELIPLLRPGMVLHLPLSDYRVLRQSGDLVLVRSSSGGPASAPTAILVRAMPLAWWQRFRLERDGESGGAA